MTTTALVPVYDEESPHPACDSQYCCPRCGCCHEDQQKPPYFRWVDGGSGFDGEYTQHWGYGEQTCARCGYIWGIYESD